MMAALLVGIVAGTPSAPAPQIVPQPKSMVVNAGAFQLKPSAKITAPKALLKVADQLRSQMSASTGYDLPMASRGGDLEFKMVKGLGDEGYRLHVEPTKVRIESSTPAGAFYGSQTLLQLFPADIYRSATTKADWTAPCVKVEDEPRFRWRGAMMDVARHFMPKEFVLKFLDLMAMHKLNRFHWHLTEDQGWRIEIKRYPKLTEIGAWRKDTMLTYNPPTYTGKPYGGFYTQDEIREVVAYAKERHITVVPEIEMPGHAQAAIAAYPELGNLKTPLEVGVKWGVYENVFNVEPQTFEFLKNVLTEVMELFPDEFIHIGGDECPKVQWKNSESAQAVMKREGLKTEEELQSWFIRQIDQFLDSKGRRLIGWSEILEGGLAPGAALMVWLGDEGAMEAVESGHDVVMAQTSHMYFDYYQSKDTKKEPHAIGGFLPLNQVYAYNPILPKMSAEHAKHVMGVQFQLWSEYIRDPKHMEYMAFPRACAQAEVAWSPQEKRSFEDFSRRLPTHLNRLKIRDVNFRKLD